MAYLGGQLLVATPRLADPNFFRTVVFLLDHDEDGAVGVVLNRPSELPVVAVLPEWSDGAVAPAQLFTGGPVTPEVAVAVGVRAAAAEVEGFRPTAGDIGLVDLESDPEVLIGRLAGMRLFAGYAGWGHEQLLAEIAEGSWYVVGAQPGDLLTPEPESLWRVVLRRQPGELAYVANCPDDPTMN